MMVEEDLSLLQNDKSDSCSKYLRGKRLFYLISGIVGLFFLITIIVLGVFLAQGSNSASPQDNTFPPTVLIISIDGFRWDYLDMYKDNCTNILKFASQGVRAQSMRPVFPSKTFPNHYTIVTGLYPESHGIIANTFYDPVFNATFNIDDPTSLQPRWWGGEPIWVTAQLQNQKAAPFFWPGSGAEIDGMRPTYWEPYSYNFPYSERVAKVISYFDLPRDLRPTFVSLYLEGVDSAGHNAGPNSPEVAAAISKVDMTIASLLQELTNRDMLEKVNIIITADHGMASLSRSRVIFIDDYVDLQDIYFMDLGTNMYVLPVEGKQTQVYESLLNAHPNMAVYYKDQIPEYWDYNDNRRITPIFGALSLGWTVTTRAYFNSNPIAFVGGNHGYDNRVSDMQAIFMARGPQFKDGGVVVEPFENIHLYSLMCHMLGLEPAPNNGSYLEIQYLLK